MLLYHGTTKKIADKALKSGLKPRGSRKSLWDQASDANCVYLTNAYAPYFSMNACQVKKDNFGAVIAVDTDLLDKTLLHADEDACEQATRKSFDGTGMDMNERTCFWRDNPDVAERNKLDWKWSLDVLGTCRYNGVIPPSAIKKVATWNQKENSLIWIFDPTITLMNYAIMGERYRYLTNIMMQEPVEGPLTGINTLMPGQEDSMRELLSKVKVVNV